MGIIIRKYIKNWQLFPLSIALLVPAGVVGGRVIDVLLSYRQSVDTKCDSCYYVWIRSVFSHSLFEFIYEKRS